MDTDFDSGIEYDDFYSDNEEGADSRCPLDDPRPPSPSVLSTIDEDEDRPEYGLKQKRGLTIGQRIQALYQLDRGDLIGKIIEDTSVSQASIYKLRTKAISNGWTPGTPVEPHHVDDKPRSGRPRVSQYITAGILTVLTRNSTSRGYSCCRIAREVSTMLPGKQFVSASTVYRTLIAEGYGSYKRTVKPGLNQANKDKRLAWCLEHSIENGWDLEKWKSVIWTDETSVQLGSVRGKRRIWRKADEAYYDHVVVERWKGF
jgi:hypothetical protein